MARIRSYFESKSIILVALSASPGSLGSARYRMQVKFSTFLSSNGPAKELLDVNDLLNVK